jgi:tRNA-specific 2-thiouridylase
MYCNSIIKFGQFYSKIDASFDKVASGHYAKAEYDESSGRYLLKTSPDLVKDQTYFLAYLTQKQLSRALFPIGKYKKKDVRALAEDFNLPNKNRKDSQGICFLGKIKFKEFIKHHLGELKAI